MSRLLIVQPMKIAAIGGRGSGVANLLTPDPKEVWVSHEDDDVSVITIDLGAVRTIDTIFLGTIRGSVAEATWAISAGVSSGTDAAIVTGAPLRVPDVPGTFAPISHALWHGTPQAVRYLTLSITRVSGQQLSAGVLVIGKAFVAELGREWGFGRQPVDTGAATSLPSGGFAVVEGVRKVLVTWTFGDLSFDETDQLEQIGLALGETLPGLIVEDASATAGLRSRIHYGLFKRWRPFERRNRRQTRWEIGIEQWV